MTTRYKDMRVESSRCRSCDHDLFVISRGLNRGEVRCSNPTCKYAAKPYKMGKELNKGLAPA